jgi:WD40 repeat protein
MESFMNIFKNLMVFSALIVLFGAHMPQIQAMEQPTCYNPQSLLALCKKKFIKIVNNNAYESKSLLDALNQAESVFPTIKQHCFAGLYHEAHKSYAQGFENTFAWLDALHLTNRQLKLFSRYIINKSRIWSLFDSYQFQGKIKLVKSADLINKIAFSSAGEALCLIRSDQKSVDLFDLKADTDFDKPLNIDGGGRIGCLAVSSDKKTIALALDKTIRLVNRQTGACITTLHDHAKKVTGLSFSQDGKILASGSDDETIKLWDCDTGECIKTFTDCQEAVYRLSFSFDGKIVASSDRVSGKTIHLWDCKTGKKFNLLVGHTGWIKALACAPDSKIMASGTGSSSSINDNTVRIWDYETGKCIRALIGHTREVNGLSFSTDGKVLASCSYDRTIKLWDLESYECIKTLNFDRGISDLAFSSDSKRLFFVSQSSEDEIGVHDFFDKTVLNNQHPITLLWLEYILKVFNNKGSVKDYYFAQSTYNKLPLPQEIQDYLVNKIRSTMHKK